MARTQTVTKLGVDRWAEIMGIHPLHVNQVFLDTMPPTVCAAVWLQHAWQDADRIGRDDLALAIREAEDDIERELKSRLAPSWELDEWQPTIRVFRPELTNLSITDIRGYSQIADLKWMNFITGGIEAKEVITAGVAITYTDSDGDGYSETATVTATVAITNECEIHIYYPGKAGEDNWEIRPIEVSIIAGVATITFRRELAVIENEMEKFDAAGVEGTNNTLFLTTVDVYRKYNDPQQQINFLWEPFATCVDCFGTGCESCAYSTQTGCLLVRSDPRLSTIVYHPANWNSDTLEFDAAAWLVKHQPDLLRVWYYAGLRDKSLSCSQRMPPEWERVVAYFAAAKLDRPLCECNNVSAFIDHWRRDLSVPGEEDMRISDDVLDNPFGTQRGAVYAWQRVKRSRDLPQEIAV